MLFPFDSYRKYQKEFSEEVYSVIDNGKILLAEVPTGVGKTAAVLSAALDFVDKYKILFLTPRNLQHKIVYETLDKIESKYKVQINYQDIIGKRNLCLKDEIDKSNFYEACRILRNNKKCEYYENSKSIKSSGTRKVEDLIHFAKLHNVCPYELAIRNVSNADLIIGNYHHVFNNAINQYFFSRGGIDLSKSVLIIDEAHNLPDTVADIYTKTLSPRTVKLAMEEAKTEEVLNILEYLFNKIIEITSHEREVGIDEINLTDEDLDILYDVGKSNIENKGRSSIFSVYNFFEKWYSDRDGFVRVSHDNKLWYLCLDPSKVVSNIFSEVHSAILMSGTLSPIAFYRDLLGLNNSVMKKFGNPFPIENRKLFVVPNSTTRYSKRGDAEFRKIGKIISNILKEHNGNAMILFPSYQLRDEISKYIVTDKNILLEDRGMKQSDKVTLMNKLNTGENILLAVMGSNFSEGIDFPGDLLNVLIIVGLPLTKPDITMKLKVKYFDEKFGDGLEYAYYLPTFIKIRQALGRLIRSETDKGVAYFIDERYSWKKYFKYLPKDWLIDFKPKEVFS